MVKKTPSKPTKKKAASRSAKASGSPKNPASKASSSKKPAQKPVSTKPAPQSASKKPTKKAAPKASSPKKPVVKKTVKEVPAKKPVPKTPATRKASSKKTPSSKPAPKKSPAKKAAPASSKAAKASGGKKVSKKPVTSKVSKKPAALKKPVVSKKTTVKAPAAVSKQAPSAASGAKGAPVNAKGDPKADAGARKGITVVTKKSPRRPRNPPPGTFRMPPSGLANFSAALGKPLIPSGPAAKDTSLLDAKDGDGTKRKKSAFNKRELNKFRKVLETKRDELSGEVSKLEDETMGRGASERRTKSQGVDDQGSEAADQAIGLDLVAAERRLLSEIVAAIRRIDGGTFGVCELTGRAINKERLEELPWTRYSIDAARQIERRSLGS